MTLRTRSRLVLLAVVTGVAVLSAASIGTAAPSRGSAAGKLPSTCKAPVGSGNLTIVSDLPLQGSLRVLTTEINKAITLLLTQQNFKAGKYSVKFVACDDSTAQAGSWDSATCTANAKGYASDKSVIGVVGTFNSGCAQLEMPTLNRAPGGGVAMVSPANTYVGLTRPTGVAGEPNKYFPSGKRNYARVAAPDNFQGAADALFAQQQGYKSVYILNDGEAYGKGIATNFENACKALGITVLGNEKWDKSQPNYQSLFQGIKDKQPAMVFLGGIISNNGGQLIKDKVAVLGDNTAVPLFGPDGFNTSQTITDAGAAAQGMFLTIGGQSPNDLKNKAGAAFVKAFKAKYHVKQLQAYTAYGAEAAQVLLNAIAKSDGTRSGVTKKLYNLSLPQAIIGSLKIDAFGDPNLGAVTVQKVEGQDINTVKVVTPTAALAKSALG
jgi:branched-chain amino acid transport system substrate-binding protein